MPLQFLTMQFKYLSWDLRDAIHYKVWYNFIQSLEIKEAILKFYFIHIKKYQTAITN